MKIIKHFYDFFLCWKNQNVNGEQFLGFFLKISKFQTQVFLFPFEPKNEWEYFLNFVLASKISQIKRNEGRLSH